MGGIAAQTSPVNSLYILAVAKELFFSIGRVRNCCSSSSSAEKDKEAIRNKLYVYVYTNYWREKAQVKAKKNYTCIIHLKSCLIVYISSSSAFG
jgi:hypothetical protein